MYSRIMPAVEGLMRPWFDEEEGCTEPINLEGHFRQFMTKWCTPSDTTLSQWSASLPDMVRAICLLFDIPVDTREEGKKKAKRELIESLHVLFSLYLEFKNSQHFGSLVKNG